MESKEQFFNVIHNHYKNIVGGKLSTEFLEGLSERITEYYYEQYTRFRKQYPKSIKRYSSFQIKDLDHPETTEMIIKFFKNTPGNKYPEYAMVVLNMSEAELEDFEKSREDFHNMF